MRIASIPSRTFLANLNGAASQRSIAEADSILQALEGWRRCPFSTILRRNYHERSLSIEGINMTHTSPAEHGPEFDEEVEPSSDQAEALDLSTDDRKLVTQPYDLSVKGISADIESGNISLTIEYQRKYVWDLGKASRLVESLLLNVPIPVCYFAEDENGVYEVIDGLQRLQTIKNYMNNEFHLQSISVLTELEGKKFRELAPRDRRRLENRTIRCIVITEDSHPDIKFDVFERLNTGAAMLTAQELRNSVYRGPFNDELKNLAAASYFTSLTGSFNNKRMDLEELILRFFSLVDDLDRYKPPLRQHLNEYMRKQRNKRPTTTQTRLFEECCEAVGEALGNLPFRVADSRTPLNKALFDAIMVSVAHADRSILREKHQEVSAFIADLPANPDFRTAIGRATADRFRMLYRIGYVAAGLRECGVPVNLPEGLGLDDLPKAHS